VGGQEPGFHDPRQVPARGVGYFCDPTPGRHTSFMAGTILERNSIPGPYVELWGQQPELHDYANKSATYGVATKYEQVLASSGSCKFIMFQRSFPLIDFIAAATGWDITPEEVLLTGERIQTLRQLFNIREGIRPVEFHLPERVSQPATTGPFKQTRIDFELLRQQYYKAMNWDSETGHPLAARLQQLGLEELITGNKRE
jgi:aldehyde:ferredoxin oxidoreductase